MLVAMDQFSQVFGFLKIIKESIKLVSKNGRLMASITTFTLVPPSLLLVLVVHFHKFLTKKVDKAILESLWSESGYTPNQIIAYNLVLLLLATFPYVLTTSIVSYISATAVILVSASSYTGNISSFTDLLSQIKATCARLLMTPGSRRSRTARYQYATVAAALATGLLVIYYPNAVTFGIGIVAVITLAILGLHTSVVTMLAAVISVVEESCEAEEKAEEVVRTGQRRLDGFMINLVVGFPLWIEFTAYSWMFLQDQWYLNFNFALHGLIFLNSTSLAKMFVGIAYTVLYFHHRGRAQEIHHHVLAKK